jgi:DNA-binding response OmpR family regulator
MTALVVVQFFGLRFLEAPKQSTRQKTRRKSMKILIVEDDLSLSDILAFTLRRAGFEAVLVYDGEAALEKWASEQPDLILLDLNLPKLGGLEVCRRIRAEDKTPIIILSVRGGDEDVVKALEMGADDYVVKPFSPSQLVARVRAVLRRAGSEVTPGKLEAGGFALGRERNELQRDAQPPVRLTPLEARLLEALMLNAGRVLTADRLIAAVWGADGGDRAMLKQLVYRLRAKFDDPNHPLPIETIPGIGYAFGEP